MKVLNKKGFVLLETLVVTVFVVSLFILVYQNVIPLIGRYEGVSNYDDIDSLYIANIIKQDLLKNGNFTYIDEYLDNNTYLDITDCNNTNIYTNTDYCMVLSKILDFSDNYVIYVTEYNISKFKSKVNEDDFFDSGKLSNFREYVNTVADTESFANSNINYAGKYRIFLIRNVKNMDNSNTKKYANLGVFVLKETLK